jgi:hypothetical protein
MADLLAEPTADSAAEWMTRCPLPWISPLMGSVGLRAKEPAETSSVRMAAY